MIKTQIILTSLLTIGLSLLNVSPSFASGTENPNAGSVREEENDSDSKVAEKLEGRRESRRERRKRQKIKKSKKKPVQKQNRNLIKEDETKNEEGDDG